MAEPRKALKDRWKFLETGGFYALRALVRRPGMASQCILKFQCLKCCIENPDSPVEESFLSCSTTSASNLKRHYQNHHSEWSDDLTELWQECLTKPKEQWVIKGEEEGANSTTPYPYQSFLEDNGYFKLLKAVPAFGASHYSLTFDCLFCQENGLNHALTVSSLSLSNLKRHVKSVHPDYFEEYETNLEEFKRNKKTPSVLAAEKTYSDPLEQFYPENLGLGVEGEYPWDFLYPDWFRLYAAHGDLKTQYCPLKFKCLVCKGPKPFLVHCARGRFSGLKAHIRRRHNELYHQFLDFWSFNYSKNMGHRSIEDKVTHQWEFLEELNCFVLSTHNGDLEEKDTELKFRCIKCDESEKEIECTVRSLYNLKKHLQLVHKEIWTELAPIWNKHVFRVRRKKPSELKPKTGGRKRKRPKNDEAGDNDDDDDDDE